MTNIAMGAPSALHLSTMYKGIVTAAGLWQIEPAAGWIVAHKGVGQYTVTHFQKNIHYSVSLITPNGVVSNMTDIEFDVLITDAEQQPIDADWSFSASFVN